MAKLWYFDVLPCRLVPYDDECLSSYLLRLAEANGHICFKDFAFQLFPTWRSCVQIQILRWEFPVDNWAEVPRYTQLSVTELERMTLWPWVAKFRQPPMRAPGQPASPGAYLKGIVEPDLRVCPLCLQEQPYVRLMWRLAPVQACLRHGCQLQRHCHVCYQKLTAIGWQHRHLRCASCGADLAALPVTAAPADTLALEAQQQPDFQYLLDPAMTLVRGVNLSGPVMLEQLPEAIGMKLRYLRQQTGHSLQQMERYLDAEREKASRVERGDRASLQNYLTYLASLSCSWRAFAELTVPPEFAESFGQHAFMELRLCPEPDCPNHEPPTSMRVQLVRENAKSGTVRFRCTTCGCQFIRRYTGELAPVKPRRSPIPPDNKRQLSKPAAEVALLKELGLQGRTNQEIAGQLGWREGTIQWYWYALGLAEEVHQAQQRRRQEKMEQRRADLLTRVETVLTTLCQQDEEFTLAHVRRALGRPTVSLDYYDEVVQRVREVARTHNSRCKQRRLERLRVRVAEVLADLPNREEGVTMAAVAREMGLTKGQLYRAYPELWRLVSQAIQKEKGRLRELKRQRRCDHIDEVAAPLVARGERLTIKRLLKATGVAPYIYVSDPLIRERIQQWVWHPGSNG
jgi:transcriptional regulator with XRE-family HTH domain